MDAVPAKHVPPCLNSVTTKGGLPGGYILASLMHADTPLCSQV